MGLRERAFLSVAFAMGSWLLSLWLASFHPLSLVASFGFEYGNIAQSLVQGQGFSDSMVAGSGPTAWMPPLLPGLYAGIFALFGLRTPAAEQAALLLKACAAGLALFWLLGYFSSARRARVAAVLAVALWLLDWRHSLVDLNDSWLVQLFSTACLGLWLRPRWGRGALLLAALLPLASPALALPFALIVWRRRAWMLLIPMLLTSALWGVRHQLVLGQFYPIKSNLWFDLALANLRDDDGVLTASTVMCFHPIMGNPARQRYLQQGEREFVRQSRFECQSMPLSDWWPRCLNRLGNCAWKLGNEADMQEAEGLLAEDIALLQDADLMRVRRGEPLWMYMDWPDQRVAQSLPGCPEAQRERLMASRRQARQAWLSLRQSWGERLWSYAFTLGPALACLVLLGRPGRRAPLGLYLGYLLPYVLVQHYARYQVSMLFLQVYLVVEAGSTLGFFGPRSGKQARKRLRPEEPSESVQAGS